jgi:hypothetical protein
MNVQRIGFRLQHFAVCVLLLGQVQSLLAVVPGDNDPTFGTNGWVRIPIDVPGQSKFDSARAVKIRTELVAVGAVSLPFQFIYVAGHAGDRIAIAKLNLDGTRVTSFGNNGVLLSTQAGITHFAGLELIDNGDVVIGYSRFDAGQLGAFAYQLEVFNANGSAKTIRTITVGSTVLNLNYVGSKLACAADTFFVHSNVYATAMAKDLNNRITIVGSGDLSNTLLGTGPTKLANRSNFLNATGNYAPDTSAGYACVSEAGNSASATIEPLFSLPGSLGPNLRTYSLTSAEYVGNDLWVGGYTYVYEGQFPNFTNRYLGTVAGPISNALPFQSFDIYGNPFWDARQTFLKSLTFNQGTLFEYGEAETGFFGGGNFQTPIIVEPADNVGQQYRPHLFPLNALLSTSSVNVQKGLRFEGTHLLLGALRFCFDSNNCTGEQDRFFVARSATAPTDGLTYGATPGFGFQGSQQYRVPSYNNLDAPRAWAFDGAIPTAPANEAQNLIVVGDFRGNGIADLGDYDWFVTRIRLRGAGGILQTLRSGTGNGSVSSSPAGISCSPTCSAGFAPDTEVTLIATPAPGSIFSGWAASGDCFAISGTSCRVRIDGDKIVAAMFTAVADPLFQNGFE